MEIKKIKRQIVSKLDRKNDQYEINASEMVNKLNDIDLLLDEAEIICRFICLYTLDTASNLGVYSPGAIPTRKENADANSCFKHFTILWRYRILLFCSATHYFRLFYQYRS